MQQPRFSAELPIKRYGVFIQPQNSFLEPKIHFRGKTAVVLYRLVPDPQNPDQPAPMLEKCLEDLWIDQVMFNKDQAELEQKSTELKRGLASATRSLMILNKQRPDNDRFNSYANPRTDHVDRLEQTFNWGLDSEAQVAREKANERLAQLSTQAIVHGDLHLRNILMRGSNAYLIDYSATGPGHPAVDLVRLEMCLFLQAAHHFGSPDFSSKYQQAFSIEQCLESDLTDRFPVFHQWELNKVCTHGCVKARDGALEVLETYGGSEKDYIAVKYLIAWQCLLRADCDALGARSTIETLAQAIMEW